MEAIVKRNKIEKIIMVSPQNLRLWEGNDRLDFELETEEMKKSLLNNGQTSPITIRPYNNKNLKHIKYEVIDGQRRFHAAHIILKSNPDYKLKAVVQNVDDKQAYLIQLMTNKKDSLSGYSQACSYRNTLQVTGMKQFELAKKLNIARSTLTRRLSYLQIDQKFWDGIPDKRLITDSIANDIVVLLNKTKKISHDVYNETLQKIIEIFHVGYSRSRMQKLYNSVIKSENRISNRICNDKGILLCTLSQDGIINISAKVLKNMNFKALEKDLIRLFDKYS